MTADLSPADLPVTACDFCDDKIVWTVSTATGTPLPVDATPSEQGNLLVQRQADGTLIAGVASSGVARSARKMGRPTYLHHAMSCPRAGEWNKPARRPAGRSGRANRRRR